MNTDQEPTKAGDNTAKTNPKYKSSVFSLLFSDPDRLRELYYAIEGIIIPPDLPVKINTLANPLVMGKLNDISFAVDNRLVVLIEHQSTINENMPFRLLEYIVRIYGQITNSGRFLKKALVKIPKPEFIVLYNGPDPFPEHKEYRLSDAFMDTAGLKHEGGPALELVVRAYNINHGMNPEMLKKSETLGAYSAFIGKIRGNMDSGKGLEEAMRSAVEYCKEHGILTEFLKVYGSEVVNMMMEEYSYEDILKAYREAYREEGLEEGRAKGLEIGREEGRLEGRLEGREEGAEERTIEIARKMKARGRPFEEIAEDTGLSLKTVETL